MKGVVYPLHLRSGRGGLGRYRVGGVVALRWGDRAGLASGGLSQKRRGDD